tara:strand:- start:328 stop:774 length:447 start_codon:yes stop_codon:yes gene_type:complete
MADSKLSELTAATSVDASDTLYVVQSSTSKKVTAANIFGAIATPTVFSDKVSIGDHQTVTSAGVLSNDYNVHVITDPASSGTLTMTAGVTGQIKIIIMSSNASAVTLTLDDSDLGHDTITFDNAGDTATLIYAGSKWWSIGGSAAISN